MHEDETEFLGGQFNSIELLERARLHSVRDAEGAASVKGIGCKCNPVRQRYRQICGRQHIEGAGRRAVGAAENQIACRYGDAADGRLRRSRNYIQYTIVQLACVPCQTCNWRSRGDICERTRVTRCAENLEAV